MNYKNIYGLIVLFSLYSFSTMSAKAVDCAGDGPYEFGTKHPGKADDEAAPFIKATPPGSCQLKADEKNKIINELLKAQGTAGQAIAVLTMGAMGCGKSSSLATVLKDLGYEKKQFINIDVDDIKAQMTPFKAAINIVSKACPGKLRAYTGVTGWCAKEGSEIRETVLNKALQDKRSFILDGTCRFPKYCQSVIEKARHAGFVVYVVAVYADVDTCIERAKQRSFHTGRWTGANLVRTTHEALSTNDVFNKLAMLAVASGGNAWIFDNSNDAPIQAFKKVSECKAELQDACEYYGVGEF